MVMDVPGKETFSVVQLYGFILVVIGTLIYNEIWKLCIREEDDVMSGLQEKLLGNESETVNKDI